MKTILASFLSLVFILSFYAFSVPQPLNKALAEDIPQIEVPGDVQTILDKSCLPCHGPDGSGKAKMKFNWEKLPEMSVTKQVSKLSKVVDKVEADKMPTPKYIKKHPDAKLTDEQKKILIDWADSTAEGLVSGE